MKPEISLIIPCFNQKKYLPRLFDSILRCRFSEIEVIVVDDCSDIKCDKIVKSYIKKGLNIVFIRNKERLRTLRARFAGVQAAQSDIIGFADADDILLGDALSDHLELFRCKQPDILQFRAMELDENLNPIKFFNIVPMGMELEGASIFSSYVDSGMAATPTWLKLYTRELWLSLKDQIETSPDITYLEDVYISALLFFHCRKFIGSERVGYGYVWDPRPERNAARSVEAYLILKSLVPYFQAANCNVDDLQRFILGIEKRIVLFSGRFCGSLEKQNGFDINEEDLSIAFGDADPMLALRVMTLANKVNAGKLVNCSRIICPPMPPRSSEN